MKYHSRLPHRDMSFTLRATSAALEAQRNASCHPDSLIYVHISIYTCGCSGGLDGGGVTQVPKDAELFLDTEPELRSVGWKCDLLPQVQEKYKVNGNISLQI